MDIFLAKKAKKREPGGRVRESSPTVPTPAPEKRLFTLYAYNLSPRVNESILRAAFEGYDSLHKVDIIGNHPNANRCFAFVHFLDGQDFLHALKHMPGKMILRKPLYIKRRKQKPKKGPASRK